VLAAGRDSPIHDRDGAGGYRAYDRQDDRHGVRRTGIRCVSAAPLRPIRRAQEADHGRGHHRHRVQHRGKSGYQALSMRRVATALETSPSSL
jgi:hypothetical protein